jgi:chromosome segregation ATPase
MTPVRMQPLAASTAMLAAEHERLDRAKAELEKEIAEMVATQVPTGDDLVRALAQEIANEEARVAEKRAALQRAEAALRTQERERQEANAERLQERYAAAVQRVQTAEEERLDAIERIDTHAHAIAKDINDVLAALAEERTACVELGLLVGRERVSLHAMDDSEQRRRIAARIIAIIAQRVKAAQSGFGRELRFGGISWTLERADGWTERERRLVAPDIDNAISGWRS